VGVRGARLSVGPRGTYVHVGAGGLRYSQRLDRLPERTGDGAMRQPSRPSAAPPGPSTRPVELLDPALLVDSTSDELLDEIRRKHRLVGFAPVASGAGVAGLFVAFVLFGAEAHTALAIGALSAGILAIVSLPWVIWSDRRARLVRLRYLFDPLGDKVHEGLAKVVEALGSAHALWAVRHEHVHGDWKRHAGAGTSVVRRRAHAGWGAPNYIHTNARVGFLRIDGTRLYFFPDRLLIFSAGEVAAARYADLTLSAGSVQFMEEGGVPRDATVVGTTWRYVNKNGGPDRRFNNNYQIPMVRYGTLEVSAPTGMRLSLQTSAEEVAASAAELLRAVQGVVHDLDSKRAASDVVEQLPDFAEDSPPLSPAAAKLFRALGSVLSMQWLDALPDWASLPLWGILFSLPPVALINWFAHGGRAAAILLCAAGFLAGVGGVTLVRKNIRRSKLERSEAEDATISRFRALLTDQLKSPLEELNFGALIAASGISLRGADRVADETYRKVADRFAGDGVITENESRRLRRLANAMCMSSDRASRIEAQAKAARYELAASNATADHTAPAPVEAHRHPDLREPAATEVEAFSGLTQRATPQAGTAGRTTAGAVYVGASTPKESRAVGHAITPVDGETSPEDGRGIRWFGRGTVLWVQSIALHSPMIYASNGPNPEDEGSCVDLNLGISQLGSVLAGPLPSYPTYAAMSPHQRLDYVRWLSRGRTGKLDDPGYALLFLHGLERRLLLERKDTGPIVTEVIRLLETGRLPESLDRRLTQFLVFALARYGVENVDVTLFRTVFEKSRLVWDEEFLAVALAWFYARNAPLSASWALRISRRDLRPGADDPAFEKVYTERYGHGLLLTSSGADRHIFYLPSNRALHAGLAHADSSGGFARVPDILGVTGQFAPLGSLWKSCNKPAPLAGRASPEQSALDGTLTRVNDVARIPSLGPVARAVQHRAAPPPARGAVPQGPGVVVSEVRVDLLDLATNPRSESAPGRPEPRWYGKDTTIAIGGFILRDAMVYVAEMSRVAEASCIDLSLEVGKPADDSAGSLGYYTTYARLTPAQRANYLQWLAGGRTGALRDIGYAFLFLYGFERRLLVEQQDLSPIVKEVVRLLETYTFSGSFDGYLSRFLAFVLARAGIETLKDKWFEAAFTKSRLQRDDDFLAVALAWIFKRGAPLPVNWAMRICLQDPRCPRGVVWDRLQDQFAALFEGRYHDQFGDGLVLRVSKRERTLRYRPASPALLDWGSADRTGRSVKIPDVLGIQSQFAPLVNLWSSCIEELRPLSRVVAKGLDVATRDAFEVLPEDLKARVEHPDKPKWDRLVAEHTAEDGFALVQVAKLASIHGVPERAKLTPKQSQALAQTAEYVGLNIEPDARVTNRPYNWDDIVSLLRPENRPALPSDSRYLAASLMLELGVYVAAADGTVEDAEVDQVARFLESQFLLDPPDSRRLEALKRVFAARPPTITGLGRRLQTALSKDQRESVARFLTGIAAANGIIDRSEVTALRGAYRALGVEVDSLNKLLEEFRRASQEPVEVQRGDQSPAAGEAIPPRPPAEESGGFALNEELLNRLMTDTQAVARLLGEAMRGDEMDDGDQTARRATGATLVDPRLDGLDVRFHGVLCRLLAQPSWQRADYESLVREFNLMPDGTLDRVNEWSFDRFNDQIIVDDGGELSVQANLLEGKK
jgi:uncharacterized tellurite resistance protein B-like protein